MAFRDLEDYLMTDALIRNKIRLGKKRVNSPRKAKTLSVHKLKQLSSTTPKGKDE